MNGIQYDLRSTRLEYVSEMRYIDIAILILETPHETQLCLNFDNAKDRRKHER